MAYSPRAAETGPHRQLAGILSDMGLSPWNEFPVGKYFLDIFIEEYWVAFEYDGPTHSGLAARRRDEARDAEIMRVAGIPVLRVNDALLSSRDELEASVTRFIDSHVDTLEERRELGQWVL